MHISAEKKTRCYSAFFLCLLAFFFSLTKTALSDRSVIGSPFITNYTSDDYNAHFQNWAVVQDSRGIMYIGNWQGILEYDGNNWQLIQISRMSSIRSLAIGPDDTVYVGGIGEIGYLAPGSRGETTYHSLLERMKPDDREFNDVWKTFYTSNGVYFLTLRMLIRFHQGKISVIPLQQPCYTGAVVNDRIYLMATNRMLYTIQNNNFFLLPLSRKMLGPNTSYRTILPFSLHRLMVVTDDCRFFIYDMSFFFERSTHTYNFSRADAPSKVVRELKTELTGSRSFNIRCAVRIKPGLFAMGSKNDGLVLMDKSGKIMQRVTTGDGLNNNCVWDLLVDRNGNLWAALNNGLAHIDINSSITMFDNTWGLDSNIRSIIRYHGNIYVTAINGIYYLQKNMVHPEKQRVQFRPVSGVNEEMWDFLILGDVLLAGGHSLYCINRENEGQRIGFLTRPLYCFGTTRRFPDHIFTGQMNGLECFSFRFERNKPDRWRHKGIIGNIRETIRTIVSDDRGDLWLSTQFNGIIHLKFQGDEPSDCRVTRYTTANGLPRNDWNMVNWVDGRLIIGTQFGIYTPQFTEDDTERRVVFKPDVVFGRDFVDNITIGGVMADHMGRIWINSYNDQGMFLLTKGPGGRYLRLKNPLKKIHRQCGYLYVTDDDIAWLAGPDRLYRYDISRYDESNKKFNVMIRKVSVKGRGDFFPRSDNLNIKVPYKKNVIQFLYASTFHEAGDKNLFSYKLEDFDEHWSDWSVENKKEYTNLSPGDYCFKVRSKNVFLVIGDVACFNFTITPPWYRTSLAMIGFGLFLALLVFISVFYHVRRVRQVIVNERRKYELSSDMMEDYAGKLLRIMDSEKPFLNENIHIEDLAKLICIPTYQLSQILNQKINRNFNDFVNQYRIKEAQELFKNSENVEKSILDVAYAVGFNSKSTFYNAFKKFTRMTPYKYLKQVKQTENPIP